jgi:hypothetical protein
MEALRRPDLRVLYTTGYISYNSALGPGAHLLTKPFSMTALATKIREVVVTVS